MSIFPINSTSIKNDQNIILKEYAWDFENNDFLKVNGDLVVVTGIEAVKVWIYKTLKTQKYKHMAYTQSFGNGLDGIIGKKFSNEAIKSEVERYLKESLLINKDITGVKNISATITGSKLNIDFIANTIYGEVTMNV